MKTQLLKLLTVGLITFAVLSPALLVGWRIWHYHSMLVESQHVVLSDDRAPVHPSTIAESRQGEFLEANASHRSLKVMASLMTPLAFLSFIIAAPAGFWAGLWLSDRYQTRRTVMLRQQVATLERLWQQSLY